MSGDNFLDFLDNLPKGPEFPYEVPEGLRLVSYALVSVPFRATRISTVVNAEKFITALLLDAKTRLRKPETYACPSMKEILGLLKTAGVRMEVVA
jgi:hypothetical protein